MTARKGIILAGGSGTRLYPITIGVSKQLLPLYDKPMIYYPLSVLMLAGIREIAVITTPEDQAQFRRAAGRRQPVGPAADLCRAAGARRAGAGLSAGRGLPGRRASAMVLGDNIFFGHGLPELLAAADARTRGGTVFGYHVADPERYGVVDFDVQGRVRADRREARAPAVELCRHRALFPRRLGSGQGAERSSPRRGANWRSPRCWRLYLAEGDLTVETMGRGFAWLDTGTHASLLDAGNFVRTLEQRQGLQVGCPDEIAYQKGWIDRAALAGRAGLFAKTDYGRYLARLAGE